MDSISEQVRIAPVPDWVEPCSFDAAFRAKDGGPVTHLLVNRQVHADERQVHVRNVIRLENIEAVQHWSQWKLEFEPATDTVHLHWIKIRRGDLEVNQLAPEKIRLIQRESGLEHLTVDGWYTMLLILEDVRPGDVLDSCFTTRRHPRLLADRCEHFFSLQPKIPIGKFEFKALFNEARPLKWKSCLPDELPPVERRADGQVVWSWSRENFVGPASEPNTPSWHLGFPWIQISDHSDWQTVSTGIHQLWKEDSDSPALESLVKEISEKEPDPLRRIEKAIQLLQDEYRYLSVNLELGGQIPASPTNVIQHRYGDCKDLSFLLVHLLRKFGVRARPVLVNSHWRKTVAELLPAAGLFNHVVVEYEIQGKTRWVDVTLKHQGGGLFNRFIPDYGVGLPIDALAAQLAKIPAECLPANAYELKETLLLDTTGAFSSLAVVVTAKGQNAEILRNEFEGTGKESMAANRLQLCANRYGNAKRIGEFQCRDSRDDNEFTLAETFEINGFLRRSPHPGACFLQIPIDLVANLLPLPEPRIRKSPFALFYPCRATHVIEIQSPALRLQSIPNCKIGNKFFQFSRTFKSLSSYISITFSITVGTDSIPVDQIEDYCKAVAQVRYESIWNLQVAIGHPSPCRRRDFGQLPFKRIPVPVR